MLRPSHFAAAPALHTHTVERLQWCARCRADQRCPAGVATGDSRPQPQRERVLEPQRSCGHWPEPAVYVPHGRLPYLRSSDLPSGGLKRALRWGRMPGASSSPVAGLGGGPVGRRGQGWEVGCTYVPSHRAVFAGCTVAQVATRGWVRSSGRLPSPAPPARWYLP